MKRSFVKRSISLIVLLVLVAVSVPIPASAAAGIANNGHAGITIDINAHPFTTYANKSWGQYAYGEAGCA